MGGGAVGCRRRMTGEESRGSSGCPGHRRSGRSCAGGGAPRAPGAPVPRCSHLADAHVARCGGRGPLRCSRCSRRPGGQAFTPLRGTGTTGRWVCARDALPGAPRAQGPSGNSGRWASGSPVGAPGFPARRVALGVLAGGVTCGGSALVGVLVRGWALVSTWDTAGRGGWVLVPAPATGHPHRDKIIAPRAGPLLGTASTRWAANSRLPQVPPLPTRVGTS